MLPQLVFIANHAIYSRSRRELILPHVIIPQYLNEDYCLRYTQLTNIEVKQQDSLWVTGKVGTNVDFMYLGVNVNLQKHILQLKFPFIYRAFADFEPLRNAIFNLLEPVFRCYGTTECAIFPSYWKYSWTQYNNQWKYQRLEQMQQKILNQSVSYKRTILNITHCLGEPCSQWNELAQSAYRRWWKGSAYLSR